VFVIVMLGVMVTVTDGESVSVGVGVGDGVGLTLGSSGVSVASGVRVGVCDGVRLGRTATVGMTMVSGGDVQAASRQMMPRDARQRSHEREYRSARIRDNFL
jgi:hypothetical protein